MTPEAFITLRTDNPLTDRAGAQALLDDLCDLPGAARLHDPDNSRFERGTLRH